MQPAMPTSPALRRFRAVVRPGWSPPLESPSPIFPGAGLPIASVQQAGLIGGAFPGQMALNGVVRARPTVPATPVNPAVVNPGTANVAQSGALGQVTVARSGNAQAGGPYGGAAAVLPPQSSSPTGPGVPTAVPGAATRTGPYGGFEAVQPPALAPNRPGVGAATASAVTGSQTAVNPVFERFFAGLNAAVTPTTQPTVVPAPGPAPARALRVVDEQPAS
jgi:hypothetical protein